MKSTDDLVSIKRTRTIPLPIMPASSLSPRMLVRAVDDGSIRSHGSIRSAASLSSTFTADSSAPNKPNLVPVACSAHHLHHHGDQSSHKKRRQRAKSDPQKAQHHHRRNKLRHRVSFDESLNQWHKSSVCFHDLQYLWYQPEDYMDFHEDMVAVVAAITTVPEKEELDSCETVLERVFEACHSADLENTRTVIMSREEKKELKGTFKTTPELLGLERSVSLAISQDRSSRQATLIETLDDLQSCGWPDMETEARKLCEASMRISRTSRLLARHLAVGIAPSGSISTSKKGRPDSRCRQNRSHSPPFASTD